VYLNFGDITDWSGAHVNVYTECDRSPTFPIVDKDDLYQFLEQAQQDEIKTAKAFRELVKAKVKR
jgi:hypothetical protein